MYKIQFPLIILLFHLYFEEEYQRLRVYKIQ
jgi:hypothetical protein